MDAEDQAIILLPSLEDYTRSVTAEPEPSPPEWYLCSHLPAGESASFCLWCIMCNYRKCYVGSCNLLKRSVL